jgi:hypothetical protein
VTVLSPPAPATPAVDKPAAKSAAASRPEQERQAPIPLPTLDELLENLAAVTATLEELRRAPVRDFQVQPDQEAWSRLSREADKVLADIRSARTNKAA